MTMDRMVDFIIVGAMKAGTTYLSNLVSHHPDVHLPSGEIHYFNNNYEKGYNWYFEKLFAGVDNDKVIGEKTPTYAILPEVAERIERHNPNTKLIWILRNPIKRAYSHYWFWVQKGRVSRSFKDELDKERRLGKMDLDKSYISRGLYIDQLEHYTKVFGRENMHVIIFENFVKDKKAILSELFSFLNVDPSSYDYTITNSDKIRTNKTRVPFNKYLQHISYKLFFNTKLASIHGLISRMNLISVDNYPPMEKETLLYLQSIYDKPNKRLAAYLGQNLPWN